MPSVEVDEKLTFYCPFCSPAVKLKVIAGEERDGRPTLLHEEPPCQTFIDLDIVEFLTAARKRMSG